VPQDIEAHIAHVLQDLRPDGSVQGQELPACSLEQRMADCATPGISIGVIDEFQVVWAGGFGKRTAGTTDEVTPNTPFQAGSISKPVFALAVMKLVEKGQIDLDADVNHYLESWQIPTNEGWQPRVTLRQLLSHTAGTSVHGFPGYPTAGPWPAIPQILEGIPPANTPPVVVDLLPGIQFRYSGGGTMIAQQLVVDLLGKPLPDIMRELVLDPLEMSDSTYEQPLPAAMAARAATAHPWNGLKHAAAGMSIRRWPRLVCGQQRATWLGSERRSYESCGATNLS
jgi:CubicO group peptidase (beta-lactamase class C family)